MNKLEPGDKVLLRFCLWSWWMTIEGLMPGLLGTRYIATVSWSDEGNETYIFRRWRIKAWRKA